MSKRNTVLLGTDTIQQIVSYLVEGRNCASSRAQLPTYVSAILSSLSSSSRHIIIMTRDQVVRSCKKKCKDA